MFVSASLGARAQSAALSGQLQDTTGAIIPGAPLELDRPDGSVAASAVTDSAGHFRAAVGAGNYTLKVILPGFEPLVKPVHAPASGLTLTMALGSVSTSVTVNADDAADAAATENNHDAASMSAADIKSLPILDNDVVATLSAFLDAGASGEGGPTLIIDGVEMKSLGIAPSAIERISINQNPYSAQYNKPGRGQIEIVTKDTEDKFHGEASFTFRDAIFNARNHFAPVRPPEQRRAYEGFLTGPVRPLRDTTFLFSIERTERDSFEQVSAIVPPGFSGTGNVAAPSRNTQLTMKLHHGINDHHSQFLLYRFFDVTQQNEGVGGLTLGEAGFNNYRFDMDLTFHDDNSFSPRLLNQFNVLFERNIDRQVSTHQAPLLSVAGAFNAGGAQQDVLQTENNPNISDIVSWQVGRQGMHQLKFGIQLPNLGRRVIEDNTNRQGTYTFASYAAFLADQPNTFTIQQGQSRFLTHLDQPGAFFLDEIKVNDRLSVTPGIRYDFQNALPNTKAAIQPRLAVAYVLDKVHSTVLRVGGGVYVRRVGNNILQQLARYQNAAERSLLLTTNVCYSPLTQCNVLTAQPSNLFLPAPGMSAPFQGYFGVSLERALTSKSTVTLGYEGYRGWHALRSVDINAPLPPFTSYARPNPSFAQILQLQSGGYQKSDSLIASFRGRLGPRFAGFGQYTYGHADSNTTFSTYQPANQYDPNADWSRSDFDQRHRLSLFGTFFPDHALNGGVGFYAYSGLPYSVTTGTDDFKTGTLNAHPYGTPRNSLTQGGSQDVQLRLNYTRKLRPRLKDSSPTVAFSLSSFNTLNRANYESYVGVITSPRFMQPTSANSPRRLQFNVAYTF